MNINYGYGQTTPSGVYAPTSASPSPWEQQRNEAIKKMRPQQRKRSAINPYQRLFELFGKQAQPTQGGYAGYNPYANMMNFWR